MSSTSILACLLTLPLLMTGAEPSPKGQSDVASLGCELQKKKEDTFTIEGKGSAPILCIHSASGIGGAEIMRRARQFPATITLRFQKMRMLEMFTAKIGKVQISGALKSAENGLYFDKDGKPQEKAEGSAFSLQIVSMNADAGIEVRVGLPATARELDSIDVHWIDAFR